MSLIPGTLIGHYRALSLLGEGGMGAVYRGEHVVLGRQAAIKVLLPHIARDSNLVQRFINEARVASMMNHRNVVSVLDCGTFSTPSVPEPQWYIALEFLEGKSLGQFIGEYRGNPIDIATIIHVIGEAANGLHAAHERHELVHRDVKPDNLYLTQTEDDPLRVKILDFGIAKLREQYASGVQTRSQVAMGTPAYAAPEQLRESKDVDARADVWALGVITHEMITGVRPWGETTSVYEIIAHHSQLKVAPDPRAFRPDTPPKVAEVIARAMEPDPNRRWRSAKAYACALADAATIPYSINGMAIFEKYAPELTRASVDSVTIGRPLPQGVQVNPPQIATSRERPAAPPQITPGLYSPPGPIEPARPISTLAASAGQSVAPSAPKRGRGMMIAIGALALAAMGIVVVLFANTSPAKDEAETRQGGASDGEASAAPIDSLPTLSTLAITTSPDGSQVFVDGIAKGRAPLTVELPIGTRVELRAESQGYSSATRLITVEPTQREARIELVPLIDAGVTASPVDAPPAVRQVPKQPHKRGSPREPPRNDRGSGSGSASSDQGFSPNDVL